MIRFQCDYAEGAHPLILQKMAETNEEQTAGYGNDPYCECARKKIRTPVSYTHLTLPTILLV